MSVPASAGAANGAVLPVKEIVVATPNVKTVIFGLGRDKRRIKQMSQTSNVSMQWREELNVPDVYLGVCDRKLRAFQMENVSSSTTR